ncbi:response regulator [Sulfitobacter guttiformis]|uniref:Response regulator receiver domain-containing protein n=1 Tax=Sulfitobacter guttiformis TaxID=74349 RepID=A0A420DJM2_9RHOB|nr:response regulator [Sulfitobacter guttiformis]KIN71788.1 Two-component response regulator [Sulfitobacter guttiformis KCTC 32187]RKE94395.1 response regulator receiver domain-containing protein [Sulfitobacter guttiformis]
MTFNSPVILHVDDEHVTLELIRLALEEMGGIQLIQCSSGRQAVELAKRHAPDLFLLDVMMPEIDGLETLQLLREIPEFEHTPVIFLTAKIMQEEQKTLLQSGARAIINKPFDAMTVASNVVSIWSAAFQDRIADLRSG